jgi:sugar/nucleoside kinase (ribokinase family)
MVPHVKADEGRADASARATQAIFAGLATLDVIQLVERLPLPDEKVAALAFALAAGGPAANAAIAFAACGGAPGLVTALPEHPLTDTVTDDLEAHGVRVERAGGYSGPPITASIMVTRATGARAVVSPTISATDEPIAAASMCGLEGMGAVLVDGYFRSLSLPLAFAARARGIPVVLDAGSFKPYTDEVLAAIDVAVVSDDFAPRGTGGKPDAVLAYLGERGVKVSVITRGARPIVWRAGNASGEVEVQGLDKVVDTLGAGDFFHGALTYRIADLGLDVARLPDDLSFAADVAARSLGSFGTRAWLRTEG